MLPKTLSTAVRFFFPLIPVLFWFSRSHRTDVPAHACAAMFNSGQSCCGIERVYVHEAVYDRFVEEVVKVVKVRSLRKSS